MIKKKLHGQISVTFYSVHNLALLMQKKIGDFREFRTFLSEDQQLIVIEHANRAINHEFAFLGGSVRYGKKINWHRDFKSGFEWHKGTFYTRYSQVDLMNNADVKIPRELSRCHHMLFLGEAYLISGNEDYTKEFMFQVKDWIDENPLLYSINWGCTMDVAIRASNWIYSLAMFIHSPLMNEVFCRKIISSLYEHGWFIRNNFERNFKGNANHFDANIAGLLTISILFGKLNKRTRQWYDLSRYLLFDEIRQQILPSGVILEKSINYIRLVTEFFSYSYALLKKNKECVPSDIIYRLESLFRFTQYYMDHGISPVIGDQDNARYLPFSITENRDHRYLLSIASVLFENPVFKQFSGGWTYDSFFLSGTDAKKTFDALQESNTKLKSICYKDAGFYIMRNDHVYLFINNSGQSKYPDHPFMEGSHTHADLLSFELHIDGISFLIDPGSYVYTASASDRNLFRSTAMHNTVEIDSLSQYKINERKLFAFESPACPVLNKWITGAEFDLFDGEHDAYFWLAENILHRRVIRFDKINSRIDIQDHISGTGTHKIKIHYHPGENIPFRLAKNKLETTLNNNPNMIMIFGQKEGMQITENASWISTSYGSREEIKSVTIELSDELPLTYWTQIEIIL